MLRTATFVDEQDDRNPPAKYSNGSITSIIASRQLEVLKLISQEYNDREIAEKLFISKHTAHSHRKNLMSKLKVKNAAGLVRRDLKKVF